MNPYLKALPPVPEDFDASASGKSMDTIKQLVMQHNSLTYIGYVERLPNYRILQRELKQRGMSIANVAPLLWIMGHSYELLPIPMCPDEKSFEDVHFLYNSSSLIEAIMRKLARDVGQLYQKLNGVPASIPRIHSVSKNPAFYNEMSDDHKKLYMQCKLLTVLSDYRDMLQRDVGFMESTKVQERRQGAIQALERAGRRGEAPVVAKAEKPREELHFTMSGMDEVAASTVHTVPPAGVEEAPRRAIDQPEWKNFESAQKSGFTWEMVMRTFGPNMVIRILLRRHDYEHLLSMIEADFITDPAELRYCRQSMEKIQEHGDLPAEHEESYWRLYQYLKARGF